ncbi:MAG TPA: NAD-dependent epimerase/dehydratase family protein [Bryobacteraceae bacterium]|nr:NAD-dependent epimerase/dehydratase family protein [Bryobacteraceae bacterium]
MKILVTGGTGFVGSHVVERLVAGGARVRCLVRASSSLRYLPREGVELVQGDLAAGTGLEAAVEGADVVAHVGGVTKALSEDAFYQGNLRATENLLHACRRQGDSLRRFVHVSSLAAIGPSPGLQPLDEDATPHPLTWYGRSKLAAEGAVRASTLADRAAILRPPVVYGPRDTDVFEVFRSVAKGLMVRIGRPESYFSYIHVKDLAEAIWLAVSSEAAAGRTYFVANPEPVSWTAFAQTAAAIMGRRVRTLGVPAWLAYLAGWCAEGVSRLSGKPGIVSRQKIIEARCRYWTCDPTRARQELGFQPARGLREGLEETLAWYKDSKWLKW